MRRTFVFIFFALILALLVCSLVSLRSKKKIGRQVAFLTCAFILPIFGNIIGLSAQTEVQAYWGSYVYFIGMDFAIFAFVRFTVEYCKGTGDGQKVPFALYGSIALDVVQLLLNPIFHHAFTVEEILVEDLPYYRIVPHLGQAFHRLVIYLILACAILIYIMVIKRMPSIYTERYSIILFSVIGLALWQTFYVISRTPINTSMLGYGILGLLIFYFALFYRPMKLLDRMLSGIVYDLSECLFIFDPNATCIWANRSGREFIGVESEKYYEHVRPKLAEIFSDFEVGGEVPGSIRIVGTPEGFRYYRYERKMVKENEKKLAGYYIRIKDCTEEQFKIKQEIYASTHDTLTGLFTKEYLYQEIKRIINANPRKKFFVMFINIKNFKLVNDIFGTAFGDYALKSVADIIRNNSSGRSLYGRISGDKFGILMHSDDYDEKRIVGLINNFVVDDGTTRYNLVVHCGMYEVQKEDEEVSVMFDRAHLALNSLKDDYKNQFVWYDSKIKEKMLWNQQLTMQMQNAIDTMQIRPYLQPIVNSDGIIIGAEALARWIHPEKGFLSPAVFIPVFEGNGMIIDIDRHMWRCACKTLAEWKKENKDLFISVNISPKDFYFTDVVEEISNLVKEYDIDPHSLRIEITETVMINDVDDKMEILEEFRQAGFIVEMDDFGSGYSSFNMLKDMPVDVLKIDMKFLSRTTNNDKAKTIVKNIINLSEELGIVSLTEGVETSEQYRMLSDMGCRMYQGYHFAKPMPVLDFEKLYKEHTNTPIGEEAV